MVTNSNVKPYTRYHTRNELCMIYPIKQYQRHLILSFALSCAAGRVLARTVMCLPCQRPPATPPTRHTKRQGKRHTKSAGAGPQAGSLGTAGRQPRGDPGNRTPTARLHSPAPTLPQIRRLPSPLLTKWFLSVSPKEYPSVVLVASLSSRWRNSISSS